MIHLQIVDRGNSNFQRLIRTAIASGKITSFETAKVKGGLKITHKKYLGAIHITPAKGLLLADVTCKNAKKEWQLLEAFVGRLAYHFTYQIAAINMQFDTED
jgi:sulfite reductase beta subunit-like hemoprotein